MNEKDKFLADQAKRIVELEQLVEKLLLRIAIQEKNSKNSSKPQKSDIAKRLKPNQPANKKCNPSAQTYVQNLLDTTK